MTTLEQAARAYLAAQDRYERNRLRAAFQRAYRREHPKAECYASECDRLAKEATSDASS